MFLGIAIAVWIATGILSYGIWVHEWKREFDYFAVGPFGLFVFALGPFSLLATIFVHHGSYGFDLHPYSRDVRFQNYSRRYNNEWNTESREQFDKEY